MQQVVIMNKLHPSNVIRMETYPEFIFTYLNNGNNNGERKRKEAVRRVTVGEKCHERETCSKSLRSPMNYS